MLLTNELSTKMADKVVLYSYYRSSASWRVRIALALKNIKYEYKAVHLVKDGGEQKTEEYKKLNPMAQVPTLHIEGQYLTQSLPIVEYLEEKYPDPPLLPKDSIGRAQVRALAEIVNSGIQPLQNLNVLQKIGEGKEEWARHYIDRGLVAFEAVLEKTAGQYCYGDSVTIADIFLIPQLYNAKRFNVDMSNFPIINRIQSALVELPAFKAADASRQPDTPEDQRAS